MPEPTTYEFTPDCTPIYAIHAITGALSQLGADTLIQTKIPDPFPVDELRLTIVLTAEQVAALTMLKLPDTFRQKFNLD